MEEEKSLRQIEIFPDISYFRQAPKGGQTLEDIKALLTVREGERLRTADGESYTCIHCYPFYVLCRDRQGRLCGLLYQDIERGRIPCR